MKWNLRVHMTAAPGDDLRRSARRTRRRRERAIRKKGNLAARGPRRRVRLRCQTQKNLPFPCSSASKFVWKFQETIEPVMF